jgi:hypothetical protein
VLGKRHERLISLVILAQARIQNRVSVRLDSRLRGNDRRGLAEIES